MKLIEKILFPTDYSEAAEDALQIAMSLAKTFNAEIIPFHATLKYWDHSLRRHDKVSQLLQEVHNRIHQEGIRVANPIIDVGTPFDLINRYADRQDVNLIVMGSKGVTKGAADDPKHPLGLTAEKVMRIAHKPVWVVKQGSTPVVKKIVCAIDFSPPSRRALDNAVHLARDLKADLTVVHAIEPLSHFNIGMGRRMEAETRANYEKAQRDDFDLFLRPVDFYHVEWDQTIRHGQPHQEILAAVRETGADLLIMGSEGRTGLSRILMGSVAEKVVREVPCSVITVKAEDVIRLQIEEEIADVEARFHQGKELLEEGFPIKAMRAFEYCIEKDRMFAPAWEGLGEAHEHLGHKDAAEDHRRQAQYIHQKNWEHKVEAEIRGKLWGKKVSKIESL